MAIAGDAAADAGIGPLVEAARVTGFEMLTIRLSDPARALAVARAARSRFKGRLMVAGRADIAALAGADGTHLGESGIQPRDVRRAFPELRIGVSRHDRDGLLRAGDEGVDYVLLGPVFATPGKERGALGLARFEAMTSGVGVPVWAVGGITPSSARACIDAGAAGVAAIRPFTAAGDANAFRDWAMALGPRRGRA